MKRILGLLLFVSITLGCYADKVKGELRTEINGFQWYCYKGKEAYAKDGTKLFGNLKDIKNIQCLVADKDDYGVFWIEMKKNKYGLYEINGTKIQEYYRKGHIVVSRFSECFSDASKIYYVRLGWAGYNDSFQFLFQNGKYCPYNSFNIVNKFIIFNNVDGPLFWKYVYRYDGTEIVSHSDGYKSSITYNEVTNHFIHRNYGGNISIVNQDGVTLIQKMSEVEYKHNHIIVKSKDGKVGIINYTGQWIVPLDRGFSDYNTLNVNNQTYYLIKYKNESHFHLISNDGNDVLGKAYDAIESIGGNLIKVKNNAYYGVISTNGKDIISINREYTSIGDFNTTNKTFAFTKKGYSGVCNERGEEISTTRLAPTSDDIKTNGGYANAVELNNGSTKYWKVSKGGRYGLTDSEGREIVPCEMEALESAGTGYLKYKINGFWGVMNYAGKILIDTDRGYTSIGNFVTFTKRFPYTMTGYKGECDINGKQISKIKVETPKQEVAKQETTTSEKKETIIIEHKHDPIPVNVWVQCNICGGSGRCQTCGGSGIFTGPAGNKTLCSFGCGGSGKCSFCAGSGGHYEVEYK